MEISALAHFVIEIYANFPIKACGKLLPLEFIKKVWSGKNLKTKHTKENLH